MNPRLDKLVPGLPAKLGLMLDTLLVVAAWWLIMRPPVLLAPALPALVLAWLFAAAVLRLYSPCTRRGQSDDLALHLLGAAGVTLTLAACCYVVGEPPVPGTLVDFGLTVFVATTLRRVASSWRLFRFLEPTPRILIVGTSGVGRATYERVVADRSATVVGFLSLPHEPASLAWTDVPVLGNQHSLLDALVQESVSEVYFAVRVTTHGEILKELVHTCEEIGVPFALPLHSFVFERASLLSSPPSSDGYLHYQATRGKPGAFALKRLIDIILASTALLVLSPLLVGVAIAIKLTSRGPVLFRQVRVGLHGTTFNFLKFRSMVVNAEELRKELLHSKKEGPVYKMKYDPRITRVGRLIRKYSIDELPQLVNVLRGDMTIVGPRPALPEEVATYEPWQRRRLSVRPGLTCFWQVHHTSDMSFERWMQLDLYYVDNWSLTTDFVLMAQTVPVVLAGRAVSNELLVWRGPAPPPTRCAQPRRSRGRRAGAFLLPLPYTHHDRRHFHNGRSVVVRDGKVPSPPPT